jgi:hypothetical protein
LVDKELKRRGKGWSASAAFISSLTDEIPTNPSIDGHVAIVREAAARRKLAKLCQSTLTRCYDAKFTPADLLVEFQRSAGLINVGDAYGDSLGLINGSDVVPEDTRFLIPNYVPEGQITLMVGNPGDGKTFTSIAISADITVGRSHFFAERREPRNVLYLGNEDPASILRNRFDRAGGDPSRIWFESVERAVALRDVAGIEAAIKRHEVALVVIDTITTHFGTGADFHKASDVAAVISPVAAMAQRTGAAVIGLMHLSKSSQSTTLYRVQGSVAFAGAARSVLAIGLDPSDPSKKVMAHLKSNGAPKGQSHAFQITDGRVVWGGTSGLSADDILAPVPITEDRSELDFALEFLREALSQGSRDAADVKAEAKSEGVSERTLKRAKAVLKIESRKKAMDGGWIWCLPEGAEKGTKLPCV